MNVNLAFRPRLVESLKTYSRADFRADLVAGLTVGIVALPLAMAFGIASGVTPAAGIYTAVVAGFLISALGGTKVSIGGPTGAFIAILHGIYQQYGAANAAICTMMAGMMLVALGWAKLGTMIKFIPFPVTMGFTSGIAVVIFSTQVKDFLGLQIPAEAGEVPKGVMIHRLFGVFFFGAADKLETTLMRANQLPDVLILRLREVVAIDATGINALEDMHEKLRKRGKHLILCGPHTQPLFALDNAGFLDAVGRRQRLRRHGNVPRPGEGTAEAVNRANSSLKKSLTD